MGLGTNTSNTKRFIWALINLHMIDEESEKKIKLFLPTIPLAKENKKKNTRGWTCYSKLHKGFERLILNIFNLLRFVKVWKKLPILKEVLVSPKKGCTQVCIHNDHNRIMLKCINTTNSKTHDQCNITTSIYNLVTKWFYGLW